jgi:hypothetical protein
MAAMGKDDVGRSRALPGLLALTLVACGGRYNSQGHGGGEPTGDDISNGAGGSASNGGSVSSSGGSRGPGPTVGGMSSGVAGTGVALGGAVGTGGAVTGAAGTTMAVAGSSPGSNDDILCKDVCSQRRRVCNDDLPLCMSQCLRDVGGADECSARQRETYKCLSGVFADATSCKIAFYDGSKLCSAVNGRPEDCGPACDENLFGDGTGCHNIQTCEGREADLHCLETGGEPRCSCSVNGVSMFDGYMAGFDYAKAACLSQPLIELCASYVK